MLKVIASSTCDVCFVEYADDNPPYCIPCGHISCKSCLESMIAANAHNTRDPSHSARCAFCRTLFEQSGVRRLHVDLGAVPSEFGSVAGGSDDGSETVNGEAEDENRVLARQADKLAVAVANATFERDADKIKSTSAAGQRWVAVQRRKKPSAGFPVLTALTQLAVGNMENYNACRLLEQKLVDSRQNVADLTSRLQTLEEVDQRERQHSEKIRALEQQVEDLRQSLTSTERSLRTTTSSLADATASLAESDTALAAAKAELAMRDDARTELVALKAELEAATTARDESRAALSKTKKELSGVKHELKQLRADMDHAAPHTLKDEDAEGSGASPKKVTRRRSRKFSQSAAKAEETPGLRKLDGARPKKSRHGLSGEKTEDEEDKDDVAKAKAHAKDKERRERGREKHRTREHGEGKQKDKENDDPEPAEPTDPQPGPSEKPHKSKSRRKHATLEAAPPERSASAPPGTEAETLDALKVSTDSLPHTKGESSKSPDPMSPPAASGSKGTPPPTGPRRGLVETFAKPALSRDGPAMRVLRRAMGRKANSPNASHDLGSSSTVINMRPAPSPAESSSSAPATSNVNSPANEAPSDRAGVQSSYSLSGVENIAGFGIPGVVHEMSHGHYPNQFHNSTSRNRAERPPRTSDEFAWPYDAVWDQNRARGKGRDRDDRKGPLRHYVAAEDVPNLSSSRHFDAYGESPPAYPMYEHTLLDSGLPRKSSFGHLRGMK